MTANVGERYRRLVADGVIVADAAQEEAAQALDRVVSDLAAPRERSLIDRFLGRSRATPIRGLYLHGGVGRGKTMLMDLFHEAAPVAAKRRIHFAGFMNDVHERIHSVREAERRGERPPGDPIAPVAASIAADTRLLALDEFAVTDIADAMILSRLFSALFDHGLVLVATSNNAPEDLYRHGLNRQLFLPFVDVLRANAEVHAMDGDTDHRLAMLAGRPVYLTPDDADAAATMDRLWHDLTRGSAGTPGELALKGRTLRVPCVAHGAARFGFADLCEAPLGPADYLAVVRTYHTVFIDHVAVIAPLQRDVAWRFVLLVDALYDENVKLVASAAAPPDGLYAGRGELGEAFRRTVSRLVEMQSTAYLSASHGHRRAERATHARPDESEVAPPSQSG